MNLSYLLRLADVLAGLDVFFSILIIVAAFACQRLKRRNVRYRETIEAGGAPDPDTWNTVNYQLAAFIGASWLFARLCA